MVLLITTTQKFITGFIMIINFQRTLSLSRNLPILQKLVSVYKVWQEYLPKLSKTSRYTLGLKIDFLFIEIIEFIFKSGYSTKKIKITYLQKASLKLDLLKFFFQIFWDIKALDNKKYILLSKYLNEIGKMLGGWVKKLEKETPA